MARRLLRFLLTSTLLLAAGLVIRRTLHLRDETTRLVSSPDPWSPIVEAPSDPAFEVDASPALAEAPTEASAAEAVASWVAPVEAGCPATHLIKAKAASGIYHLPGMANYQRTNPDRCYADEDAATADGFTKAKR